MFAKLLSQVRGENVLLRGDMVFDAGFNRTIFCDL